MLIETILALIPNVSQRTYRPDERLFIAWIFLLALLLSCTDALAHESRPAYLELTETTPGHFKLLWRTPVSNGNPLPVALQLPGNVHTIGEPLIQRLYDSLLERRVIQSDFASLAGQRLDFIGLQATITDVLVRVQYLDGSRVTAMVHPRQPWLMLPQAQGTLEVFLSYLGHGFEHIWMGFDHLLFVFALMLIVPGTRILVWTITAFTLAHSITLALATLGLVNLPGPPVEAAIALSILLLACEISRLRKWEQQQIGVVTEHGKTAERPAASRWPWAIAFIFGLLHGFGFAGALRDIGLPASDLPLALFAFNIGVELGQLAFVAIVLTLLALLYRLHLSLGMRKFASIASTYVIGITAVFILAQRLAAF